MDNTLPFFYIGVSVFGALLSIFTITLYFFGKLEFIGTEEGKHKLIVKHKNIEFSASFAQTLILCSLSLIALPFMVLFHSEATKTTVDPMNICERFTGKYYLDAPYVFFEDDIQIKNSLGLRARALDGTFEAKFCKKQANGKVSLEGTETTTHSLEVKLKDSDKYIHVRRFKSIYDSLILINSQGEFEGRFIKPASQSPIGQKDDINDRGDYEKKFEEGEITIEDKEFIKNKIDTYEIMVKENRTSLGKKHCAVTNGSEGGRDIIAFTCLNRYTRVMKRSD